MTVKQIMLLSLLSLLLLTQPTLCGDSIEIDQSDFDPMLTFDENMKLRDPEYKPENLGPMSEGPGKSG
jgi:hypothetical protein